VNDYHRWYNTATGTWLSSDPKQFAAGDADLERYVRNDPVSANDPTGLNKKPSPANQFSQTVNETMAEAAALERQKQRQQASFGPRYPKLESMQFAADEENAPGSAEAAKAMEMLEELRNQKRMLAALQAGAQREIGSLLGKILDDADKLGATLDLDLEGENGPQGGAELSLSATLATVNQLQIQLQLLNTELEWRDMQSAAGIKDVL
jgi:hypothetical protein